jgi:hypothetical protein
MWTRLLFALLALGALVIFFVQAPFPQEEDPTWRGLLLLGVFATCFGRAVPWGRWISLTSPGRSLGPLTQLLGWSGAGLLPISVRAGSWLAIGVCVLLPVSALALWRRRAWAAWPWYLIAAGTSYLALWSVFVAIQLSRTDDDWQAFNLSFVLLRVFFLAWVTFVLVHETISWSRTLRSRADLGSSPAA